MLKDYKLQCVAPGDTCKRGGNIICNCRRNDDGSDTFDLICPARSAAELANAKRHREWLERKLQTSSHDWVVVAGHYPVYSVAEHGSWGHLHFCHQFQRRAQ